MKRSPLISNARPGRGIPSSELLDDSLFEITCNGVSTTRTNLDDARYAAIKLCEKHEESACIIEPDGYVRSYNFNSGLGLFGRAVRVN